MFTPRNPTVAGTPVRACGSVAVAPLPAGRRCPGRHEAGLQEGADRLRRRWVMLILLDDRRRCSGGTGRSLRLGGGCHTHHTYTTHSTEPPCLSTTLYLLYSAPTNACFAVFGTRAVDWRRPPWPVARGPWRWRSRAMQDKTYPRKTCRNPTDTGANGRERSGILLIMSSYIRN